jgi:hypothetical protein
MSRKRTPDQERGRTGNTLLSQKLVTGRALRLRDDRSSKLFRSRTWSSSPDDGYELRHRPYGDDPAIRRPRFHVRDERCCGQPGPEGCLLHARERPRQARVTVPDGYLIDGGDARISRAVEGMTSTACGMQPALRWPTVRPGISFMVRS